MIFKKNIFHLLLIFYFFVNCSKKEENIKSHFTEQQFSKAIEILNNNSANKANKYVDSLFNTFDNISVKDKFLFYKFKSASKVGKGLIPVDPIASQIYIDSMISLIEIKHLQSTLVKEYAEAFNLKSNNFIKNNLLEKALDAALKARTIIENTNDKLGLSKYLSNEGHIYFRMKNYPKAVKSFKKEVEILEILPQNENWFYQLQSAYGNTALSYDYSNEPDEAFKFFQKRVEFLEKNKQLIANNIDFNNVAQVDVNQNISSMFLKTKNYPQALNYLVKAEKYLQKINANADDICSSNLYFVEVYLAMNDFKNARKYLNETEPKVSKINRELQQEYYRLLKLEAELLKLPSQYMASSKKYFAMRDSLTNIMQVKESPEAKFDKIMAQQKLEMLKKDDKIRQIYFYGIVSLLAITMFFLVLTYKNLLDKKKLNAQLLVNEKNLNQLMLERDQQKDRQNKEELKLQEIKLELEHKNELLKQKQKISYELHDGISGNLTALKYYLTDQKLKLKELSAKQFISDIENEINSVNRNLKKYLGYLQKNEELDLIENLKANAEKLKSAGIVKLDVALNEEKLKKTLQPNKLKQLGFILNELYTNIIKHAKATEVQLAIDIKGDICEFLVADNGVGFNPNQNFDGMGMQSVKNRMDELNGKLDIISAENGGTTIKGFFKV
jgi:signal transduction histidine kinase